MPEDSSFLHRIRPNAEWEVVKWAWEIGRSAVIPSAYVFVQSLRHKQIDWIGMGVLFCLCLLIGFLLFPRRRAHLKDETTDIALTNLMNDCERIAQESKLAGAQARLLLHFEAEGRGIERFLTEIRDKWNYAGEHLVHPLSTEIFDWKDFGSDKTSNLTGLLRDLKGICLNHLEYIRLEFPGLVTPFTQLGYPSNAEYNEVMFAVKDHCEELNRLAGRIWIAEEPMGDLDGKKS